jgi:hypothetical protein
MTRPLFLQKSILLFSALLLLASCKPAKIVVPPDLEPSVAAQDYGTCPQTLLKNSTLTLRVMHPDPKKGFYRGYRFEWSGIISEAFSDKHHFIGLPPDPASGQPNLSLGTASEFKPPLKIPSTKSGEPDREIRIGIGSFTDIPSPDPGGKPGHRLDQAAPWKMSSSGKSLTYTQDFQDPSGYAYRYQKTITLDDTRPLALITYSLENKGSRTIETEHYCHNWLCLDGAGTGASYGMSFPYPLEPNVLRFTQRHAARLDGRKLVFDPALPSKSIFWMMFKDIEGASNNQWELSNVQTGSSVHFTADWTPFYLNIYGSLKAFCPETFVKLSLAPGQSRTWTTRYLFHSPEK